MKKKTNERKLDAWGKEIYESTHEFGLKGHESNDTGCVFMGTGAFPPFQKANVKQKAHKYKHCRKHPNRRQQHHCRTTCNISSLPSLSYLSECTRIQHATAVTTNGVKWEVWSGAKTFRKKLKISTPHFNAKIFTFASFGHAYCLPLLLEKCIVWKQCRHSIYLIC